MRSESWGADLRRAGALIIIIIIIIVIIIIVIIMIIIIIIIIIINDGHEYAAQIGERPYDGVERFFGAALRRYGGRPMAFVNLLRCDLESGETGYYYYYYYYYCYYYYYYYCY